MIRVATGSVDNGCATIESMEFTTLIEPPDLCANLNSPNWVVLDCRFDLADPESGRRAFAAAHIPGAHYADLNRELSAPIDAASGRHPLPDPAQFAALVGAWGIDDQTQCIVYDDANSSIAARAWWMLRWIGARRVAVLNGGLAAWRAAGAPVQISAARAPIARHFSADIQPQLVVTTAQLTAALQQAGAVLVDARAAARFSGVTEPIDPVAGHVPGARNFPFAQNLQADGRFLSAAEVGRRWRKFLQGADPGAVINMCGSGVTACHNL